MSQAASEAQLAHWERRRTWNLTWSRNDSMRWLDERSEALTVFRAAHHARIPRRPSQRLGNWLYVVEPAEFARVHAVLAAAPTHTARDALTCLDLFPS